MAQDRPVPADPDGPTILGRHEAVGQFMMKEGMFAWDEMGFGHITDSPKDAVDLIVRGLATGAACAPEASVKCFDRCYGVNSHEPSLKEIRHNPLLWLLALVPVVFASQKLKPEAHTLLFVLSVLAIVPLAALLSHATESVAAKTGDAVGGLLNATLGNLTELVIALAALRAGQYMLVKASIAGAIVTNTLFMLGRVVSARRTQTPRAGIQPGQRPPSSRTALPGYGRTVGSIDGRRS